MIRIAGRAACDCEGFTRRNFLQAGALGVGGLTLSDWLRIRSAQASVNREGTSVILFWLSGGPGHMETWDPKPEGPQEYRGPFGAISTKVPGVHLGELMPEQAKLMDRLAVIRTVNHGSGDHTKSNHWMLTGFEGPAFNAPDSKVQRRPSIGSAVAKLRAANNPAMPPYVALPHLRGGTDNFFHYSAYLGGGSNPFVVDSDPNAPDFRIKNLARSEDISFERLERRRHMIQAIDQFRREVDRRGADLDSYYRRAFDMLTSKRVREAFDISAEPAQVRDRYGRHMFGQSALLARRLIEAGVMFVTVNCVPWDHHGTPPQLRTDEGARLLVPPLDRAIGSLVEDLIQRGLYEKTLVVAMGEFGRTPRMNTGGGRDHWGHAFSVLMGCGSMNMGQAIGKTSQRGEYVVDRGISPEDIAATVYHHLGINGQEVTFIDQLKRPTRLIETGEPIRELVG